MLVLTRRLGEEIVIGDNVCLTVVRIEGGRVRLGVKAPAKVSVRREEICTQPHMEIGGAPSTYNPWMAGNKVTA